MTAMHPEPDPRWTYSAGGISDDGSVRPMSFETLAQLASEWAALLPGAVGEDGPVALLRTARSLFAHSWFDYDFMVVACLVGFQAMEAAFRVFYSDAGQVPFRKLVERACQEGVLPPNIAELADASVELRNLYSHPATQDTFTIGMAAPMLDNTHRMVALVMTAASRIREPQA
jgi:hypothetical protein